MKNNKMIHKRSTATEKRSVRKLLVGLNMLNGTDLTRFLYVYWAVKWNFPFSYKLSLCIRALHLLLENKTAIDPNIFFLFLFVFHAHETTYKA